MNMRSAKVVALWILILIAAVSIYSIVAQAQAQAPAETPTPAAAAGRGAGGRGAGGRGGGGGRGAAAPANVPPPTSSVTGNAVAGKPLYYGYSCYGCHGYNGETGARAFVGRWGNLQTEAGFIAFLRLRADQHPNNPTTSMPNFPISTMSDKQAKDIYAYIRTFTSHTPELKDIPTLNAIVAAGNKPYKK